jgi:hypothetical protein
MVDQAAVMVGQAARLGQAAVMVVVMVVVIPGSRRVTVFPRLG